MGLVFIWGWFRIYLGLVCGCLMVGLWLVWSFKLCLEFIEGYLVLFRLSMGSAQSSVGLV